MFAYYQTFEFEIEACSILRLTCYNKLRLMGDDVTGKVAVNVSYFSIAVCFKAKKLT